MCVFVVYLCIRVRKNEIDRVKKALNANKNCCSSFLKQINTESNAKVNPYVLFCWQRLCELETTNRSIGKDLDVTTLQSKLQDIRLCMFDKVNDGIEHLASILSDCGIVLHVAKNFRGEISTTESVSNANPLPTALTTM